MTWVVEEPVRVPQAVPVQPEPVRDQVTPSLLMSLATVAVMSCVLLSATAVVVAGLSVMTTGAVGTVSAWVARTAVFAIEVAVMVTARAFAGFAGACR